MQSSEFADGVKKLLEKKIVIIGCGAQGLAQGSELARQRLDVSYALVRKQSIRNVNRGKKPLKTALKLVLSRTDPTADWFRTLLRTNSTQVL